MEENFKRLAACILQKEEDQVTDEEKKRAMLAYGRLADPTIKFIIDYRVGLRFEPKTIEETSFLMVMDLDKTKQLLNKGLKILKNYYQNPTAD